MRITIFTKKNCPACKMTKTLMSRLGIKYEALDITDNDYRLNSLKQLGYKQMPVVAIDEDYKWTGFRPDKIKELVGIAK